MRYYYLIIIGIFLTNATVKGQNWTPAEVGTKYHYYEVDSTQYLNISPYFLNFDFLPQSGAIDNKYQNHFFWDKTFTVRVDTAITQIDSSIKYQYNSFYIPCDTTNYTQLKKTNLLTFPTILKNSNGDFLWIIKNDSFYIPNHINSILSPFIDSINQLIISVDSLYTDSIFLNTIHPQLPIDSNFTYAFDSLVKIKINKLNNPLVTLHEILLSKNHGIIELIKFDTLTSNKISHLKIFGIEGHVNAGYQSLSFNDIFDFNIGDEFYYEASAFSTHGVFCMSCLNAAFNFRLKVLARQDISPDTIKYTFEKIFYFQYSTTYPLFTPDTLERYFINYPKNFYNLAEYEIRYASDTTHKYLPGPIYSGNNDYMVGPKDFLFKKKKYIGYHMGTTPTGFNLQNSTFDYNYQDSSLFQAYSDNRFALMYQKGLGITFINASPFESGSTHKLVGYIKGMDTVGVTPTIFLNTTKVKSENNYLKTNISPNPAQNTLHLSIGEMPNHEKASILVYDIFGKCHIKTNIQQLENNYKVDVSSLENGVYFVEIKINNTSSVNKFVINK